MYGAPALYQATLLLIGATTAALTVQLQDKEMGALFYEALGHMQRSAEELASALLRWNSAAAVVDVEAPASDVEGETPVEEGAEEAEAPADAQEEDLDQVLADIKVQSVLWGLYNSSLHRHKVEKKEKLEKKLAQGRISSGEYQKQAGELEKTAEMAGRKLQAVEKAFMGLLEKLNALQKNTQAATF